MAHLKKIMRGAVPGLAVHFERKTDHHTNKEIDVSQTYLNQDIMTDGSDMVSRFNARLNDVYCMQRDDVKEPVSDLDSHSYPKILQKRPTSNKAPFLKKPPIFLMNVMVKKMPWPLLWGTSDCAQKQSPPGSAGAATRNSIAPCRCAHRC